MGKFKLGINDPFVYLIKLLNLFVYFDKKVIE
jgi:hypothetical protein